ncbi:hypothetical protein [Deinococcus aestuarii]|uniref:hypothetical protein n=1 Tax=Deinococcus aestuarii TaxID=2774531 RepID=UPI001C0B8F23|nr:hypothetical protein [Deinococcus aestuarii]
MSSASVDLLGYLASALVLATFCTRGMVPLRLLAITSNLAFIVYAVRAGLHPILLLHALLLPTNLYRLAQVRRDGRRLQIGPPTTPEGPS